MNYSEIYNEIVPPLERKIKELALKIEKLEAVIIESERVFCEECCRYYRDNDAYQLHKCDFGAGNE